jgi:hypothetical protein
MVQSRRSVARRRRSVASGTRLGLVAAVFTVLRWSAGWPGTSWRAVVASSGVGEAGFDRLLVNSAALAAWVGLGWFCLVVALALAGRAPGVFGRLCETMSRRLTPRLLRRLVEAAIGMSIVAGPLAGGSAFRSRWLRHLPHPPHRRRRQTRSCPQPPSHPRLPSRPRPPSHRPCQRRRSLLYRDARCGSIGRPLTPCPHRLTRCRSNSIDLLSPSSRRRLHRLRCAHRPARQP